MRFFLSSLFFTTLMLPAGYAAMAQTPVAPAPSAAFDAKEASAAVTELATALVLTER